MDLKEKLQKESGVSLEDRYYLRERELILEYLRRDNLAAYLINAVQNQYNYTGGVSSLGYSPSITDSLIIMNSLYNDGTEPSLQPKFEKIMIEFLQSENKMKYYTALDYLYHYLLLDSNKKYKINLLTDKEEIYSLFKNSIKNNEDYLKLVSYGQGDYYKNNLYGFAEDIDRQFKPKTL